MHPEKYWDLKLLDPPLTVGDIAAARELGKGWTTKFEGTFGELGIAALCDTTHLDLGSLALSGAEAWTHTAAAGWGGDRWWLLERDGKYVTVLALVWDSEQDAREFEKAVHLLPGCRLARRGNALVIVAGEVGKDASRVAKACAATLATKYGAR
jgi:hypothetical protein